MRIAFFLLFVLLSLRVGRERPGVHRRAATLAFIGCGWAFSLAAGLLQRDLWPFSNWVFVPEPLRAQYRFERLIAVDSAGGEVAIDARAFEPFGWVDLYAWLGSSFPRLSREHQDAAAGYLLARIEVARTRAVAGRRFGEFSRVLGPFAAPPFQLAPRSWAAGAPPLPLAGLRLYREEWDIEQRRRDPAAFRRTLVYEFRRSGP
jgi:hypothetical protein